MESKKVNNNGFEYVDLGLPSGTLWATSNVGASKPYDYGLYFQWGDNKGYDKNQIGKGKEQKVFDSDWSDYKWGTYPDFTKYTDKSATLELEDDAAHTNMGGDWHIPTPSQINELLENTYNNWAVINCVHGWIFTSKKDRAKTIFVPLSGMAFDGSIEFSERFAYLWSSMLTKDYKCYAQMFIDDHLDYGGRGCGFPIRAVIG